MLNIVCFGEVLWDVFPDHKKIGGAPLNVSIRLQSLGLNDVSLISSVGNDTEGKQIVDFIKEQGLNVNNIQLDEQFSTGTVQVSLNERGSASYEISPQRAWDNIQITDGAIDTVKAANAFVFGSLAAREHRSRNTLYELLKIANYKILDINLRKPHYTLDILNHLMTAADFIKLNDEEIFEIVEQLGNEKQSLEQSVLFIAEHTNTQSICITKGRHGAILYYDGVFYHNDGYQVKVEDTVGAGDSFLASLINQLLKKSPPQEALDFASAVGALVASSKGATPRITKEAISKLLVSKV